jgi:putative phosphoesterase
LTVNAAAAPPGVVRLAVVADVHGNLPALRAVLGDIDRAAPDAALWNAGDFVGYGPWPEDCVRLLLERAPEAAVRGNYDDKTLAFPRKAEKWARTKDPRKLAAFRHAYENLSAESRDRLGALPAEHRATLAGHRALMVHITPDDTERGLMPDTPDERFEIIARTADADVVVTGHTHRPLVKNVGGVLFVNPGSAGRPGDGDPRAAWALVTLAPGVPPRAEIRRAAYDVEEVVRALAPAGLPAEFAALYRSGRATL